MRYFRFNQPSDKKDCTYETVTKSEDEIINEYWDFWYKKMIRKYGKTTVDSKYGRAHCIRDWCKIKHAWQVVDCQAD